MLSPVKYPEPVYGTPVYITAEELRQIADFDFSNRPALAVQRDIFVPLVTMAKKILKRYESSGRTTLLPFISEQKYNDAIKEVFRLAGINRVKDPNIVASMSGHKEGSKAFARYREIDKDIKRDALKVFEAI